MTRHPLLNGIVAALAVLMIAAPNRAADDDEQKAGSQAASRRLDDYIKAVNAGNADQVAAIFHPESPELKDTHTVMKKVFESFELALARKSFTFMGSDDTFACARVSYATLKINGPAYRNNTADALWIFKKEGADWKVFRTVALATKFHDD